MKLITIITPCYNEEGNVLELYKRIKQQFQKLGSYQYEHIFVDNCSTDSTCAIIKELASKDHNVKLIVNNRNFGPNRSGANGLLQCYGDAVINLASDLQDPPEMIPSFIREWEEGYEIVLGQKTVTKEKGLMKYIRKLYYIIMSKLSDSNHFENVTGFGLYDKKVIDMFRKINDPDPYFRGMICDLGYSIKLLPYTQEARKAGKSSYNILRYLDDAITGMVSSSKKPLRIMTLSGVILSFVFLVIALIYLLMKIIYWDRFDFGQAPIMIGIFFIGSVQLAFLGVLGEYVGAILTKVSNKPLAVEREKVNFDEKPRD